MSMLAVGMPIMHEKAYMGKNKTEHSVGLIGGTVAAGIGCGLGYWGYKAIGLHEIEKETKAELKLLQDFVLGWSGAPNRRAFKLATGRAPIVNTSRKMPPTPVAAP